MQLAYAALGTNSCALSSMSDPIRGSGRPTPLVTRVASSHLVVLHVGHLAALAVDAVLDGDVQIPAAKASWVRDDLAKSPPVLQQHTGSHRASFGNDNMAFVHAPFARSTGRLLNPCLGFVLLGLQWMVPVSVSPLHTAMVSR